MNRIRSMVACDFDWLPDGPLCMELLQDGLPEFLDGALRREDESLVFAYAMLTETDAQQLAGKLHKLRARLPEKVGSIRGSTRASMMATPTIATAANA
ncbi:hypothetical protein [Caballeronia hypogeia]|nr:hypothetical protein [Caballeronia hypogeia]